VNEREREELKEMLEATPECPTVEELLTRRNADASLDAHVYQCPRCKTELALFEAFEQPARAQDAAAVNWIAKRLDGMDWAAVDAVPTREPAAAWWRGWLKPRALASVSLAFAALLVITTTVQLSRRPGANPDVRISETAPVRSQSIEVAEPLGLLREVPSVIRWRTVPGAAAYRIRLMEVDRTELWSATVNGASVSLPNTIQHKILPGKRLLFDVVAVNSNGSGVSSSGIRDFTLYPDPSK
jgi:hypothetical protein